MHAQGVARLQVVDHHLAMQLDPRPALSLQALHTKAGASEDARTQSLLKADRKLDADGGAHEPVPVNHVALVGGDLERQDLPGQLGRKRKQARPTNCGVLGHEQRAARHGAAERAEEATLLPARGGRCLHLHSHRHPGQLPRLSEDLVSRLHGHLEHWHHCADDLGFHRAPLKIRNGSAQG